MLKKLLIFFKWRVRGIIDILSILFVKKPSDNVKSILCFINGGLGDRLMSLPALRVLRNNYPEAYLKVLWMEGGVGSAEDEFPGSENLSAKNLFQKIRCVVGKWDLCYVNVPGAFSLQTELLVLLSRPSRSIGPVFKGTSRKIYDEQYPVETDIHLTCNNLYPLSDKQCRGPVSYHINCTGHRERTEEKRVVLYPGVRRGYEGKMWPLDRWVDLASRIVSDLNLRVIISGGINDKRLVEEIAHKSGCKSIVTNTIDDLIKVIINSKLAAGSDSGPAHMAAALKVPLVVLFGPTNPTRVVPAGEKVYVVKTDKKCAPCFDIKGICNNPECMSYIECGRVFETVKKVLPDNGSV